MLTATAPSAIAGLLEVRGIGLIKVHTAVEPVGVDMVVAHAITSELDRIPEAQTVELAGRMLPQHKIDFSSPSAAAQIRSLALIRWGLVNLSNQ